MLRRAIESAGATMAGVAAHLGLNASRVEDWCDPDHPHTLSHHHRIRLPARVLLALQELELAGLRDKANGLPPAHYCFELSERVGERARIVREAMADGVVDDEERASIRAADLRLIDTARRALADGGE